jgi:hypothetical protein
MDVMVRLLALLLLLVSACAGQSTPPADLRYEIPAGTAQAELRGEAVAVVSSPIKVRVGQRIVIRNDDQAMHYFFEMPVAPGQELVKSYDQPGRFTYSGVRSCSVGGITSLTVEVSR